MPTAEQGLTTEFVATYRELMLQSMANEMQITKKVLAAVPSEKQTTVRIRMRAPRGNWHGIWRTPTCSFWTESRTASSRWKIPPRKTSPRTWGSLSMVRRKHGARHGPGSWLEPGTAH